MMALPHSGARRWSLLPYLLVPVVIVLGLGATTTVWWAVTSRDSMLLLGEFQDAAQNCTHALQRSLARDEEVLLGVRAFYLASRTVERQEFDSFTALLLRRHPEISAFLWLPRVSQAQRASFESGLRDEGFRNHRIREAGSTSAMRISGERPVYYPVLFIEPHASLDSACGLDLAAPPGCRAAMTRALLQRTPVATRWDPALLPSLAGSTAPTFILFVPVFSGAHAADASPFVDPLQDPRVPGFMAAIVRIDLLVEKNLDAPKFLSGLDLAIHDISSSPPLYERRTVTARSAARGTGPRFTGSLDPGGWPWTVTFSAGPDYGHLHRSRTGPLVLAGGGLCTLLIAVLLFVRIRREEEKALLATTLSRANAELREANLRLMELDRLRDDFVSSASHELRTPVAILQGVIENMEILLCRQSGPDEPVRRLQEMARRNIDRLRLLVQQLLEASRLQSGGLSLSFAEVDLADLVREAVSNIRLQAGRSHVTVQADVPDKPMTVLLDGNRMIQVLLNLLDNAVRFARTQVRLTLRGTDNAIELIVEDDGPGVPAAELPLLFKRFTRLPSADSRSHIGLGLSIVKAIVEQHGGRVHAENRPGGGLRLVLTLPLVDRSP